MTKEEWSEYKDLEYYDHLCACGCGGRIKVKPSHRFDGIPRFINGHNNRGNLEVGRKISQTKKKRKRPAWNKLPRETRICGRLDCDITFEVPVYSLQKYCCVGCASKGRVPWNKNLTKENDERIAGMVEKSTKTIRKQFANGRKGSTAGMSLPPQTPESNVKRSHTVQKLYQNLEFLDRFYSTILRGEEHPNYRDGSAISQYHSNFTKSFREKIRSRDNHICQVCGRIEEVLKYALSVHHIHYDGETNDCSNDDDFITLCVSCHIKSNYNREYWEKFFNGRF